MSKHHTYSTLQDLWFRVCSCGMKPVKIMSAKVAYVELSDEDNTD